MPRAASAPRSRATAGRRSSGGSRLPRLTSGPSALPEMGDLALPVLPGEGDDTPAALDPEVAAWLRDRGHDPEALLARAKATGRAGETVSLPDGSRRVHLVGVGDRSPAALRRAAAAAVRAARDTDRLHLALLGGAPRPADARAAAESALLGGYAFPGVRSAPKPVTLREVSLTGAGDAELRRAAVTARAVELARDLGNTPSLTKSPEWLAGRAVALAAESGLEVEVRDEDRLEAEGFGGLVGVGRGSPRPPRLVELRYRPARAAAHVVLVGKGITFDTGGLSLKPADGMVAMKTDMSGAAAVLAVMTALRDLDVRLRVTGLLCAAENMPSGSAQRPGDVIRQYDGTTVEVLNTDAEGRLVLADGLGYAVRRLRPDVLIDVATLTGAATLGLGRQHGALFCSDDVLAGQLLTAADAAGEPAWRMPLVEDYRPTLDSDVADLRNIGRTDDHFSGGAVTAALFLRHFTAGLPWAHLDIAGPARADADSGELSKGATGYATRLLLRWLEARTAAAAAA